MSRRLVIVGASLAGLRAAEGARKAGFDGEVTLIGAEQHLPYDRPPLSKKYLTGDGAADFYRAEADLRAELDLRLSTTATSLHPDEHVVTTSEGNISYDALVIATGAAARSLPGVADSSRVLTLRTLDDADRLRAHIRPGARVVVVGGGFIGAEIASSAQQIGAQATIVEAARVPLVRAVGEMVGETLSQLHARNGVRLLTETSVLDCIETAFVQEIHLSSGEVLPADVVVIGVGAAPATEWLRGSGVELDPIDGGVVCDAFLRTSVPDVYAAGDVAHWPNGLLDVTMRLENWTNAAEQAGRAGANAADPENAVAYETVPYFWSEWYGQRIQFVGTPMADRVEFLEGEREEDRFVALYTTGDRVVGAATLNQPRKIMKLRRLISERGGPAAAQTIIDDGQSAATGATP
ncbi:FAD-dependent oxidoreductase [Nocardioides marmoriginsengisoli]|uniref:FAD-dependent oxidoreductase n=1 Tax=Nocardioides marmoriginsengisoli TaxID=661483 RepID=A0A3N0CHD6_9ACTN|nr:FAD-dependent oxidoreductase [Nocardioides marmoriginsengisoli]RNL62860.1 FAD-dependent oxidoreductase [Nocardioides marmoriginsengisoli]